MSVRRSECRGCKASARRTKSWCYGVSKSASLICVRRKVKASCRLRLKEKGGEDVKENEGNERSLYD